MSKSKKRIEDMECSFCESVMRWGNGEEVTACLWWDEQWYYLWFEPTDNFIGWCEEIKEHDGDDSLMNMLAALRVELEKIGVQTFSDLEGVNSYCEHHCGDNEPSYFYEDDLMGVMGA